MSYHQDKAIEACIIVNGAVTTFLDAIYHFSQSDNKSASLTLDILQILGKYGFYNLEIDYRGKDRWLSSDLEVLMTVKYNNLRQYQGYLADFPLRITASSGISNLILLMCLYRRKEFIAATIAMIPRVISVSTFNLSDGAFTSWFPCIFEDQDLAEYIVDLLRGIAFDPNIKGIWARTQKSTYHRKFTDKQKQIANYMLHGLGIKEGVRG